MIPIFKHKGFYDSSDVVLYFVDNDKYYCATFMGSTNNSLTWRNTVGFFINNKGMLEFSFPKYPLLCVPEVCFYGKLVYDNNLSGKLLKKTICLIILDNFPKDLREHNLNLIIDGTDNNYFAGAI